MSQSNLNQNFFKVQLILVRCLPPRTSLCPFLFPHPKQRYCYLSWFKHLELYYMKRFFFFFFFGLLLDWIMLSLLKNLTFCGCYHCWNDHLLKYNLESFQVLWWLRRWRVCLQSLYPKLFSIVYPLMYLVQRYCPSPTAYNVYGGPSKVLFVLPCFSKSGYPISFSQLPFIIVTSISKYKLLIYCNFSKSPAAAAAKSLQSCPTLCDPRDGSPPGSPIPGILQTRTLEWFAFSFSNAWKWSSSVVSNS